MATRRSSRKLTALGSKAEKVLAEKGGIVSPIFLKKDIQGPGHELSVCQIELETQNDELRRAKEELEGSRSRYLYLYENAPVGYLTFDEKGVVSDVNLTATRLLGMERALLLEKPFSCLIAPESQDVFYLHRHDVLAAPGTRSCELMVKREGRGGGFFRARLEKRCRGLRGGCGDPDGPYRGDAGGPGRDRARRARGAPRRPYRRREEGRPVSYRRGGAAKTP